MVPAGRKQPKRESLVRFRTPKSGSGHKTTETNRRPISPAVQLALNQLQWRQMVAGAKSFKLVFFPSPSWLCSSCLRELMINEKSCMESMQPGDCSVLHICKFQWVRSRNWCECTNQHRSLPARRLSSRDSYPSAVYFFIGCAFQLVERHWFETGVNAGILGNLLAPPTSKFSLNNIYILIFLLNMRL